MWQTEKGVPNELNRAIRHEQTGRSLDKIAADDNEYAQGLVKLEETINRKKQEIKEDKDYDNEEKKEAIKEFNRSEPMVKRAINKYLNPIVIKPAIKKDEKYKFDDNSIQEAIDRDAKQKEASMNYLAKMVKKRYEDIVPKVRQTKESHKAVINEIKAKNSGGVEESKRNEPQTVPKPPQSNKPPTPIAKEDLQNLPLDNNERKAKANKIISLMAKGTSKGRLEKKKRESIDTSDANTVIVDTNPQIETYKTT